MPVPLPNLDDRRWSDLVEEGRALIPLYARETWTDHNAHDPGITLMELFAWVAEMDIYQLNRIPDRHKRKFLALVGITPEPPQPARTALSFHLKDGADPFELPAGIEFEGSGPLGQAVVFRLLEPLNVVAGRLEGLQLKDATGFHDLSERWRRGEVIGLFGAAPKPGAEFYFGFTHPLPRDQWSTLFFHFAHPRSGEDERLRLIEESKAQREACRPPLADYGCTTNSEPATPPESEFDEVLLHHGARLVFEVLIANGAGTIWRPLVAEAAEVEDDTRAMTLSGTVRIRSPAQMAKTQDLRGLSQDLYYLRVRFAAGTYDTPPLLGTVALNGIGAEQAVPVEIPESTGVGDLWAVPVGAGEGSPHQQLTLSKAPVVESSLALFTFEETAWRLWELRADFDASKRDDAHFLLDATEGQVTFGDGEKGRVPPAGLPIYASYRITRAEAGNLSAGTVDRLGDTPHNRAVLGEEFERVRSSLASVTNPAAAAGGAPAETLTHAIGRAIELIETPRRAVTLRDYEMLAMRTHGVQLARVTARPNLHPSFPCLDAPGMITLIVLPDMPGPRPVPSPGLKRLVAAYLNRRRMIGTRVEVVGPTYLEVAVAATVKACEGVRKDALPDRIVAALNAFFDPLEGGPEGTGWPFGRDVYRSEILQVIDEVLGVDHVLALALLAKGCEPQCGNVCLAPTWLVAAGLHQIRVE